MGHVDVDAFDSLLGDEGQELLIALRDHDPADELTTATRLRRDHPAELVSAALTQAQLRQRAVAKFGEDAHRMYFTPHGFEQSTRTAVAAHRAARLAALGVRSAADLCCGIGGDALALARAGIRVLAVDRDPLTCAVARANAEVLGLAELIEVREADVTAVDTSAYDAVFVVSFCVGLVGVLLLVVLVPSDGTTVPVGTAVGPAARVRGGSGRGPGGRHWLRSAAFRRLLAATALLGAATVGDAFVYLLLQRRYAGLDDEIELCAA